MIVYEGIFFDNETSKLICSLEPNKLDKQYKHIHCTFKYRPKPDQIFDDIVGLEFNLLIVGYGNDGNNSGFEVKLPKELNKYYINYFDGNSQKLKTPHITTSLSYGAIAANTKNLNFTPLKQPIKVRGKFGYWVKKNNKQFLSFRPFYTNKNY